MFPPPAHRVAIAHTGAEGLKRGAAACPDGILLDLRLPDQSGLDVLTEFRRIDARIPVVFVTVVRSADSAMLGDSSLRLVRVKAVIASNRGRTTPRTTS